MAKGETYEQFVEKFEPKKTTDDCYTPPLVYEAVKGWACREYGIDPARVVRPFWPDVYKRQAQGRVMYVNLELDRASCLHRFRDVYAAMGAEPRNLANVAVWNLRGKSKPMDQLAPALIRRAAKERPIAVIVDPIYKVITGDENSADQMAAFCNQFDKVADGLGCAVIYCHHHSKGAQGGKRSMDRASGSGVFARDPDALLDLLELHVSCLLYTSSLMRPLDCREARECMEEAVKSWLGDRESRWDNGGKASCWLDEAEWEGARPDGAASGMVAACIARDWLAGAEPNLTVLGMACGLDEMSDYGRDQLTHFLDAMGAAAGDGWEPSRENMALMAELSAACKEDESEEL